MTLLSGIVGVCLGLTACSGGSGGSGGGSSTAPPPSQTGTPTVAIASPTENQSVANGPVLASFTTSNFTVGGIGQQALKVVMDDRTYLLYNAPTKQVHRDGAVATDAEWASDNTMRFTTLAPGPHVLHVELVNAAGIKVSNPEAQATRAFFVGTPASSVPQILAGQPVEGSAVDSGVVQVTFATVNFPIGILGQPHMRFFVNDDPTPFHFYAGPGVSDENGVLLNGLHHHPIHWKSANTFEMYNWDAGDYTLRFELVDAQGQPLENPEATATRNFTMVREPAGEMRLEEKITGTPIITFEFAPSGDDRIFVSEGKSGNISIINTTGGAWEKQATPFYHVDVSTDVEQGTFGIALAPQFASNHFVYLYYTTADGPNGPRNRVIRLKDVGGVGTEETTIIDNLPTAQIHNGGILRFGPDGKLYITVGDGSVEEQVQDMNTVTGKVLRLNPDGSVPADNPFPGSKVYALGWRSQFGMTFHPVTHDMWLTENGTFENDEVNRVLPGKNYGWPIVLGIVHDPRFVDPEITYTPTLGLTGILAIPNSAPYPAAYHNALIFANVNTGNIHRLTLGPNMIEVVRDDIVASGVGAVIDLKFGPDGYAYASGFSTIYRVVVQ